MRPVAKSKRRQESQTADAEAMAKLDKKMATPVRSREADEKKPRNEVPTRQIVNIMADEIQSVYEIMGSRLDDMNAYDKGLTLWRDFQSRAFALVTRKSRTSYAGSTNENQRQVCSMPARIRLGAWPGSAGLPQMSRTGIDFTGRP